MKMPIRCPICDGIMAIEFMNERRGGMYSKSCVKVSHNIYYISIKDTEEVGHIGIHFDEKISVHWFPNQSDGSQALQIIKHGFGSQDSLYLPYFEPDFSNYKKLVEKIKTYLVFS